MSVGNHHKQGKQESMYAITCNGKDFGVNCQTLQGAISTARMYRIRYGRKTGEIFGYRRIEA